MVIDESRPWRGSAEIRTWQLGAASEYEYTVSLFGIEATGTETYLASCRLDGNFPGGTAEIRFRFTLSEDPIERLEIAPLNHIRSVPPLRASAFPTVVQNA